MKKIILGTLIAVTFFACQQDKIAYIDNVKLINDYQEKKDIEARFKTKIEKFDKKADSISKAFQLEAQTFDTDSRKMSQSEAQKKYNELLQKRQFIQQQLQYEEQQIQQESQAAIDSLVKKVKDFVKEYGSQNGYTYILGANDAGSVLYGKEDKDLTETILEQLNTSYTQK
ncbi:OmpH family outer membrane protein [Leptobacterium sp. I13]|uniref:OmpH family outer membrane protein n=1 Tax=Leptobacterium meishanense TaxID=3128904 RepID=UPI0030ED707E